MFYEKRERLEMLEMSDMNRWLKRGFRVICMTSAVGLSALLLGCSPSPSEVSMPEVPSGSGPQETATQPFRGQILPISAEVEIGDEQIQLEVARTPQEQAMGLMFRTDLPPDRGMLFPFEFARPVQFWMQNTLIPLDMVFLLDGEVKEIVASAPPCDRQPCPTYGPTSVRVNQVIELAGGRAAELGLQVGDRLDIRFLDTPRPTDSAP
ncbi:hypothetical protein O77CONTIG1_02818 [Leptolyngbya sp. O-77]|nr:hypothetical protein O77CONTIG1_02818 [Leptolyngbya sp. O-77]